MNIQSVASSSISALGYDAPSMTLEVHFNNGTTYQYFDVPAEVHGALMLAPSKGQYLNENIKNVYRYVRL